MPTEPRKILIHADESCLGNQFKDRDNPGGAACLMEYWDGELWVRRDIWVSDPGTTNNRMALTSALISLGALKERCTVHFVSDSTYLVKGASEWLPGWKRRGWKRKGGPIENLDLWKSLDPLLGSHDVTWEWVKGHAGHPKNEYVNMLAVKAAEERTSSGGLVDSGFEAWLEEERERDRYLDYFEFEAPSA